MALVLALCAGCGGDGGGGEVPPPPPPPSTLTLTGTAASGAAIAASTVSAQCAAGTAMGTSQSDGSYSLSVVSGTLPCLVRVSAADGTLLHSVAAGTGASAVANITPVTQFIVADLLATDPAAAYAAFGASTAAAISATAIASSQSSTVGLLQTAGLDLSALGDLVSAPLHPKTASSAGDAYDQALDGLASRFASSGTTVTTFTAAVVARSLGRTTPSEVASLPADLLLQPQAASCGALRSGNYRIVMPASGAALTAEVGLATIDAAALRVTRADGSSGTWVANGACRFTDAGGTYSADIVVSQAGILVGRYSTDSGASYRIFVGMPEQTHTVADLAGTWNAIGMSPAASSHTGVAGSTTIDGSGTISAASNCENDSTWAVDTCVDLSSSGLALLAPVQADSAGGFDIADAATHTVGTRLFAYQAGGGAFMAVAVGSGAFSLWSVAGPVPLPTVGVTNRNWNFDMNAGLTLPGALSTSANTIDSLDTSTSSWTRTQSQNGSSVTYQTTLFVNRPRSGYFFRPAGTALGSDGTTQFTLNEFTFLRMHGMGFSLGVIPAPKDFQLSVAQPNP